MLELQRHDKLVPFLEDHFAKCLDVCETTMLTAAKQQEALVQLFLQFHAIRPPPKLLAEAIKSLEKLADEYYAGLLLEEGQQSAHGLISVVIDEKANAENCRRIAVNNLFALLTASAAKSAKNSNLLLNSPITIGHDDSGPDNQYFTRRIGDTIVKFKALKLNESDTNRALDTFEELIRIVF